MAAKTGTMSVKKFRKYINGIHNSIDILKNEEDLRHRPFQETMHKSSHRHLKGAALKSIHSKEDGVS